MSGDAPQRSQVPVVRRPPPVPRRRLSSPSGSRGPSKRVTAVVGVGAGLTALLVLLLLLILLSRGCATGSGGNGGLSTGGEGTGSGSGVGGGSGSGTGDGPSKQAGAGADAKQAGTPTKAEQHAPERAGSPQDGASAASGDGPPSSPPPDNVVTIGPLTTTPAPARGDMADAVGGGGGGGGSPGSSEFFGVKAKGTRFVYIVDCSGSMTGPPFQKARDELIASIEELTPTQKFFVMFFSDGTFAQFHPKEGNALIPANKRNKLKLRKWVQSCVAGGGTFPGDALLRGIDLKPHVIFLLTDGGFAANVVDDVRRHNTTEVVINTIAFMNTSGEALLKRIANENGGVYRFVP